MNKFRVDIDNIEKEAANMDSICKDVRQIGDSVRMMSDILSLDGSSGETVKNRLRKMQDEIIKEAAKVSTLQGALRVVANNYKSAEKNVADKTISWQSSSSTKTSKSSMSIIEWIKEKLKQLREIIGIVIGEHGWDVTKEQEEEYDNYIRTKAAKLQSEYSSRWSKASVKERENMLREYISDMSAIMGVSVSTRGWSYEEPSGGYITNGHYTDDLRNVWINTYIIQNESADYVFSTVTHELRHAYQHEAIRHPDKFTVSAETREAWKKSFDDYLTQDGFMRKYIISADEAFRKYQDQTVEVDARSFEHVSKYDVLRKIVY